MEDDKFGGPFVWALNGLFSRAFAVSIREVYISPIAISLGSYMDKAAGRRACTGKKITQDVSVLSRSCLGDVSVMSRSCLGLVSVFFW